MQPKDLFRAFNVSFVFPKIRWNKDLQDSNSDGYYCFTGKIQRRLTNVYYKNNPDYVESRVHKYRNASKGIVGDFTLQFKKVKPWPAWNLSLVIAAFPGTFPNVVYLYKFPEIDPSSNPVYNYTAFEIEWFDKIKNVGDIFDEENAFAFKGYYNFTLPPPTYFGPDYFSVMNIIFYSCIGFNLFVIWLSIFFWMVTCERKKLLLSYWFKEEMQQLKKELSPGQM